MERILVILQNAYGVEEGYVPSFERKSFKNCHTGKRLRNAIPDRCNPFIINASPKIGKEAGSNFKPESSYVFKKIQEIKPKVILACGVNARKAIKSLELDVPVLFMPHPAYRALTNETLYGIKEKIEELL
jgi:hypothetical protein